MCDTCGRYRCVPSCPSYAAQSAVSGKIYGVCYSCGKLIYVAERSVRKNGRLLCPDCSDQDDEDSSQDRVILSTRFHIYNQTKKETYAEILDNGRTKG